MDIRPSGITQVMPCDGTATSEKWCCGTLTDCCITNDGVVTLKQVSEGVLSTIVSATSSAPSMTSGTLASVTTTGTNAAIDPRSRGSAGGVIAGIVAGAVVGLAILLAAFILVRRRSQRTVSTEGLLIAEASVISQRHELSPSTKKAHVQELPEAPPRELPGDAARGRSREDGCGAVSRDTTKED